ncbi:MAG: class I SAM-dependent methyltransferase [Oligoflexia bacterium]|nr:class I SAM-dependent methyltransferase [Oligoflexia bacterium]
MGNSMQNILKDLSSDISTSIYSYEFNNNEQSEEVKLRNQVAHEAYSNYFEIIKNHHSIPVMDREVALFLKKIPRDGVILDVGGGWGWHWRDVSKRRPDIRIVIVDFIKDNLFHATKILKSQIGNSVFLVHGDATNLKFEDDLFDGYWTVQTLQHIPNYSKAVEEAYRVLKPGGVFCNYSFNNQLLIRVLYRRILKQNYFVNENVPGHYFLARASNSQYKIVKKIFKNWVSKRYTEILFKPELGYPKFGRNNIGGKIDSYLSEFGFLFSSIARQCSYHTTKGFLKKD